MITFGPGSAPPPSGPPPADTTAPDTVIGSGPAASGTATSATFTFSSTEGGSTFTCAVNGGTAVACTSPLQVTGLTLGSYTLTVRATDAAGNADPTPAGYAWTVTGGTTPPPSGGSCTAAPVTLTADRDAWIEQKDPGKNYGSDSVLKVRAKSGEHSRGLVRFALPAVPAGCQIVGAELRVHNGSPVGGRTIQALRVNAAWTEGGVTWTNQPATTGTAVTAATPSGSGTMTWNVTSMVSVPGRRRWPPVPAAPRCSPPAAPHRSRSTSPSRRSGCPTCGAATDRRPVRWVSTAPVSPTPPTPPRASPCPAPRTPSTTADRTWHPAARCCPATWCSTACPHGCTTSGSTWGAGEW